MHLRASIPAATALIVGAGCFSPQPEVGLDCTTDGRCPDGQVCDLALGVCVPDSALDTWRDDTAADFGDPSAVLQDATVEANGAVGPAPYFISGVATLGLDGLAIPLGAEQSITWDEIAAYPPVGRGFSRDLDLDFGTGTPPGSGLDRGTGVAVRVEGEIFLDAGMVQFRLDVDDNGVFELVDPDTGAFTRVVADDNVGTNQSGFVGVSTPGWYPFRGAYANASGIALFEIQVGYDGVTPSAVPADRLRARVDGLDGLVLDGFDDTWLHDPTGTTLARDPLDDQAYGTGYPADIGDLGTSSWTLRWSGQVLIVEPGSYGLSIDTSSGHRFWLDGELLADTLGSAPAVSITEPRDLDAGWHDVVIDVMKQSVTTAHARVTVAIGPALVGEFFPVDRWRPVHGRGARWAYASSSTNLTIPDGGSIAKSARPNRPSGATALIADVSYGISHPVLDSVGIDLTRTDGTTVTLRAPGAITGAGLYSQHVRYAGIGGTGSWTVTATDTVVDAITGFHDFVKASLTYAGGPPPFPTRAVYTSRIRDLGPAVAISGVRWQTRQAGQDGAVQVRVRSCDEPVACAAEPWTDVLRSGDAAGVTARRYLQYQVEITSNGDIATALDWIEIDYRLPG